MAKEIDGFSIDELRDIQNGMRIAADVYLKDAEIIDCGYTLENLKQLYEKEADRGIPNRVR